MPSLSKDKIREIRRAIRDYRALDPLATTNKIRQHLFKFGYKTAEGNPLNWNFIDREVKKVRAEVLADVDHKKLKQRIGETRERFRIVVEQLSRIAFSSMADYKEKIKALETIAKLDLALLGAEMDAGIFERTLGKLKVEHDMPEEEKRQIQEAMRNWGFLKQPRPVKIDSFVKNAKDNADEIVGAILPAKADKPGKADRD